MGREAGTEKAIDFAAGFTATGFNDFWNHMDYNVLSESARTPL